MNHNLPPSLHRQEWELIALVSLVTFIICSAVFMHFTWHWYSDWGSFSQHFSHWLKSIAEWATKQHSSSWNNYWNWIQYHKLQYDFLIHLSLPFVISLIPAYGAGYLCYIPGGRDRLRHISGPQLYSYQLATQHAKKNLKSEIKQHPTLGINLHPKIAIPRIRESGNIFVGGAQGVGKTVFIIPIIQQVIERGERAFIYDEKREFTSLFYTSSNSILIAPWDERGIAWNIQQDAKDTARAQLIAEHIIASSQDPLWSNGARLIFTGMIVILNHTGEKWGWKELASILTQDETTLHQQLSQYYPQAARFIVEQSKTTQSFFAQLNSSLGWLFTLAEAWPKAYDDGFSITEWLNNPHTKHPVIIVQADKRYKNIGAPLANSLIALTTSNILAQTNSSKRELWLILDELANLPKNESLMEWMSLGRSKGCRIIAGTQSISQLRSIYGVEEADTLLNMFALFCSMRVGAAGSTAVFTAKSFGERHIERPSNSFGPNGSKVINWQHDTQLLVNASDLVQLPLANHLGVEGYLLIPGWNSVYRLRWPVTNLQKYALEHCPAKWLSKAPPQKTSQKMEKTSQRESLRNRRKRNAVHECDQ